MVLGADSANQPGFFTKRKLKFYSIFRETSHIYLEYNLCVQ